MCGSVLRWLCGIFIKKIQDLDIPIPLSSFFGINLPSFRPPLTEPPGFFLLRSELVVIPSVTGQPKLGTLRVSKSSLGTPRPSSYFHFLPNHRWNFCLSEGLGVRSFFYLPISKLFYLHLQVLQQSLPIQLFPSTSLWPRTYDSGRKLGSLEEGKSRV